MGCFKVYSSWNEPCLCKVAHCKEYLVFVCALTFWKHGYCVTFSCTMLRSFTANSLLFLHNNCSPFFVWILLVFDPLTRLFMVQHIISCAKDISNVKNEPARQGMPADFGRLFSYVEESRQIEKSFFHYQPSPSAEKSFTSRRPSTFIIT